MKFRKLLLCMFTGLFLTGFANAYTYAAEEGNVVTEETTIDNKADQVTDTTLAADITTETATEETGADLTSEDADKAEEPVAETKKESTEKATAEEKSDESKEAAKETKKETSKTETKKSTKTTATAKTTTKETAKKTTTTAKKEVVKYTKAELRLLSALIYCEANSESYNGKLAVGIVVMNRVRSGAFPDTLKGVVYQKYQFGPVTNGTLSKALAEYDAGRFTSSLEKACIKAAKEALNGTKSITVSGKSKDFSKYLFFSGRLKNATFSLGNHQFK